MTSELVGLSLLRFCLCRAVQQSSSRGAFADIMQSNGWSNLDLSLRALTCSLLSWVDIFFPAGNNDLITIICFQDSMLRRMENHFTSVICVVPLILIFMIYIQSDFCSHRPKTCSFTFSLIAQCVSPTAVISITHIGILLYFSLPSLTFSLNNDATICAPWDVKYN